MSSAWIATAEVAGLLSVTERTVQIRSQRENWTARSRQGRGGGKEYFIKSLPVEIKNKIKPINSSAASDALQLKLIHDTESSIKQRSSDQSLRDAHGLAIAAQRRLDARLDLYRAWQSFYAANELSIVESQYQFAELYNQNRIEVHAQTRELYPNVSRGSIARWISELKNNGVKSLAGKYGNRKGQSLIDSQDELKSYLQSVIVTYPHITAKTLGEGMRSRFSDRDDITIPGQRAVDRWFNNWKKQNAQVFTRIKNPDEWKNKFMVANGSASEHIERLNQLWEFDASPADLLLADGRYSLSGVIDVYSRRLKLLVSKTNKAITVAALIRNALLAWGVPEIAKTDNGKEYVGHHITRVFASLNIHQELCQPFQPWMKPHIERAFRTFAHDLVELMPGYIGHNVAERKALEARKSFADRLMKKNETIEIRMTADELQKFCDRWCEGKYAHSVHGSLNGKSPFDRVANWTGTLKRITDERALDILLAPAPDNHGRRTVAKKGIRIKWPHESASHYYIAPELGPWVGRQVLVQYDPAGDMGRVFVFGDEGFLCVAECPELTGIDRQEHAAVAKALQQKHVQDQRRELKQAAKAAGVENLGEQILAHHEKKNQNVALFPRKADAHTSDQLIEAAEAAAIAEAIDTPAPAKPVSEEAMRRVAVAIAEEQTHHDTPESRFAHAVAILDGNLQPRESDLEWLRSYQQSSEFRGQYRVWRSLGAGVDRDDLDGDPWLEVRKTG